MTITSVVFGDGAPEGDWGGVADCENDTAGSADINKGISSFTNLPRFSWFGGCLDYTRNLK
jgi:hypothetical protein